MGERHDDSGKTLRQVLLAELQAEYGGSAADWTEMRSLTRIEYAVRRWFAEATPTAIREQATNHPGDVLGDASEETR